jgi:CheY-like chemotaxis protein
VSDSGTQHVLLVDDEEDCLIFVRDAIDEGGVDATVHHAPTGLDALDFLCQRGRHANAPEVTLVFLDIEMPGMSGIEVLSALRADARFNLLPIVILSAVVEERDKYAAAKRHANSFVVKPDDPDEFMRVVKMAVQYWTTIHQRPACHLRGNGCGP